jgi:hypothetical protein
MCEVPEYIQFWRETVVGWKILDNGAAESKAVSPDQLAKLAVDINVNEVIAPDALGDPIATRQYLKDFMPIAHDHELKVMAVMQAHSWTDFEYTLQMALDVNVSAIALPRIMCEFLGPSARPAAAEIIRRHCDKDIHCLGSTKHLHEAKWLARQGIVRGIDTAAPVVLGLANKGIRDTYNTTLSHRVVTDFWNRTVNGQVEENLHEYSAWCKTTPTGRMREL